MKEKNWVSSTYMRLTYGIGTEHTGANGHKHWSKMIDGRRHVDLNYLEKSQRFQISLNREAEELYFEAIVNNTDYSLARLLSDGTHADTRRWVTFIVENLFRTKSSSLLSTQVGRRKVLFVRKMRRLKCGMKQMTSTTVNK